MDFVSEFENILENSLNQRMYQDVSQLLQTFRTTNLPYTMRIFSLINRFRKEQNPFCIPASNVPYRIVIYKTGNYILDYIADQFSLYFMQKNYSLLTFDPSDFQGSSSSLFCFAQDGIDAAFFFNTVGLSQKLSDGKNLWETLSVPCYTFLVDHPMYYADSLDHVPSDTTVLCADKTHVSYISRFYPSIKQSVFLATGGHPCESAYNQATASSNSSWAQRPIDVLFIGSYKSISDSLHNEADLFILSYLQSHTNATFEEAVETYMNSKTDSLRFTDTDLKHMIESHRFTETNLSATYRRAILEDLVRAGITVHVYGEGWQQTSLPDYSHFILHKPVSFEEGIHLMSEAKIVLNHMAWFKNGSSERIFNAMSQGAICVTDSSLYLDDILINGENCFLYSLSDVSDHIVCKQIRHILSHLKESAIVAQNGYLCARNHSWQKHLDLVFRTPTP